MIVEGVELPALTGIGIGAITSAHESDRNANLSCDPILL
jgi:hypothetical protein